MVLGKRKEKGEIEIPSASLPDIVFQLLIFFLVTTTIDIDKGLDLVLPPIGEVKEISKKNITNLLINDADQILIDDQVTPVEDVTRVIRDKLFENDKLIISVKTARKTSYDVYIKVIDGLKKAGATRISLAEPETS
ncbi:biopolymer transporter ExbD [candidate division KSB1 bacterium 4484_188]|nr:MAG: biopolymer transporter ExbD [candidate division KSB1 bacterium 4484_188]HFE65217.1 biopolymer transporter ExbD [Caldithrix sp.]